MFERQRGTLRDEKVVEHLVFDYLKCCSGTPVRNQFRCLAALAVAFVFTIFASAFADEALKRSLLLAFSEFYVERIVHPTGCDQWTFLAEGHGVVDQKLKKMGVEKAKTSETKWRTASQVVENWNRVVLIWLVFIDLNEEKRNALVGLGASVTGLRSGDMGWDQMVLGSGEDFRIWPPGKMGTWIMQMVHARRDARMVVFTVRGAIKFKGAHVTLRILQCATGSRESGSAQEVLLRKARALDDTLGDAFGEDEDTAGELELPRPAVQDPKVEDFSEQLKSSSEEFEKFRSSLRAQHGPLFRRYANLRNSERGVEGAKPHTSLLSQTVAAMVQLADLRLERQDDASLVTAALELFEVLCGAVQALPQDLPPEAFMDGLRQRWRLGDSEEEKGWEACAAQAAELFRLKDTVASLYAWGLLPRKTGRQLLDAMTQEMKMAPRILDPIAGTGLHAARGTRFFGVTATVATRVGTAGPDERRESLCRPAAKMDEDGGFEELQTSRGEHVLRLINGKARLAELSEGVHNCGPTRKRS
ncbi:Palmitoyltransferase [Durusdinium trenchii]|uniref:Palmitoyltransferase n=1 Tax=Durusdinium trenchii TaxID=1381693 RepID=A0ABP0P1C1_9DINO